MVKLDSDSSKSRIVNKLPVLATYGFAAMMGLTLTLMFSMPAAAAPGSTAPTSVSTAPPAAGYSGVLASSLGVSSMGAAAGESSSGSGSNSGFCGTALSGLTNAIIKLSIYGGIAGGIVSYYATTMMESWNFVSGGQEQKLKQVRTRSVKNAVKVAVAGSVLSVLVEMGDLPMAGCITLSPF